MDREAHDENMDYLTRNNLGGENNQYENARALPKFAKAIQRRTEKHRVQST